MPVQNLMAFDDASWIQVRDGDASVREVFDRHYSRRRYKDGRNPSLFVGPGEKLVLRTPECDAIFVWRKFISLDHQEGVNCAVFRNEGKRRSSLLISEACEIAWTEWPGQRLYTYVKPAAVRSVNPGYCFQVAGWRRIGRNKNGKLVILDIHPKDA